MATVTVLGGTLELSTPSVGGGPAPGRPPVINNDLPTPPPGVWPPPVEIWPPTPLPPDYPMPPGSVWPPIFPVDPGYGQGRPMPPHASGQPLPPGNRPTPPDRPEQGLPPHVSTGPVPTPPPGGSPPARPHPSTKFLVAIVAMGDGGAKCIGYTVVDTSLSVGFPLPEGPPGHASGQPVPPGQVDNTLPPTPEPKR